MVVLLILSSLTLASLAYHCKSTLHDSSKCCIDPPMVERGHTILLLITLNLKPLAAISFDNGIGAKNAWLLPMGLT